MSAPTTWRDKYLARGIGRSSIPADQAGYFFDDFLDLHKWYAQEDRSTVYEAVGGVIRVWKDILVPKRDGLNANFAQMHFQGNWYFALRVAFGYGTGFIGVGFGGSIGGQPAAIAAGSQGPNVGFTAMVYNGGQTNWNLRTNDFTSHIFEMWHNDSLFYTSVDGDAPVGQVLAPEFESYAAPMIVAFDLKGNPELYIDKGLWVFPRAE